MKFTENIDRVVVIGLIWIATLCIMSCFFNNARDIPPAMNTILSVIVGGFVGILTGKGLRVPDNAEIKQDTHITTPSVENKDENKLTS